MRQKIIKIALLFVFINGTGATGQENPFTDCEAFQQQLIRKFLKDKPVDSLMAARKANESFRKFYEEADEATRLRFDFIAVIGEDVFKAEYAAFLAEHYLGVAFPAADSKTIQGEKIRLPEAGAVTVINTWFTRCPPCLEEMPALNELKKSYKADGEVTFISLARDRPEDLNAFLKTHEFNYEVIPDEEEKIIGELCLTNYPVHIIVDKEGYIRYFKLGIADTDEMRKVIESVKGSAVRE